MKAYTSLEQSKKLVELGLDPSTADMHYYSFRRKDDVIVWTPEIGETSKYDIPCWSLAALLDILKYPSLTQDVENKWFIMDWTGAYPKSKYDFDNPVDACYEMIMRLHELNLL